MAKNSFNMQLLPLNYQRVEAAIYNDRGYKIATINTGDTKDISCILSAFFISKLKEFPGVNKSEVFEVELSFMKTSGQWMRILKTKANKFYNELAFVR